MTPKTLCMCFLKCPLTFECSGSKGLRAWFLSSYEKVVTGQNARIPRKLLLPATLCYGA